MMGRAIILLCLGVLSFSQHFDEKDPRAVIEKVRIYRLTQELDLSTEQAMKFFPKLNEFQKIEREFNKQRMDIIFELKALIMSNADDQKISEVVNRFEELQKEKFKKQFAKMKEMWEILTPVQRAKYLIFEDEFNREIREMIKKVKKLRGP